MNYLRNANDIPWQPHPSGAEGVEIRVLHSKKDDGAQASILMVRLAPGSRVAAHVHEDADDNLYIISGRATMRVAGEVFALEPGAQVTVPMNVEHEIYDVREELLIYDVFAPATM